MQRGECHIHNAGALGTTGSAATKGNVLATAFWALCGHITGVFTRVGVQILVREKFSW